MTENFERTMDQDPWVTCPYDKVHRVPQSRLQRHVTKCEKNYPKLAICPYNATHRMSEEELKLHIKTCSSREAIFPDKPHERSIDSTKLTRGAIYVPKPFLQKDILPETDPDHEVWDD